jgi:hypothetical protein
MTAWHHKRVARNQVKATASRSSRNYYAVLQEETENEEKGQEDETISQADKQQTACSILPIVMLTVKST